MARYRIISEAPVCIARHDSATLTHEHTYQPGDTLTPQGDGAVACLEQAVAAGFAERLADEPKAKARR